MHWLQIFRCALSNMFYFYPPKERGHTPQSPIDLPFLGESLVAYGRVSYRFRGEDGCRDPCVLDAAVAHHFGLSLGVFGAFSRFVSCRLTVSHEFILNIAY